MTDIANSRVSSRARSHVNEQRLCQALVYMTSVFFIPAVLVRRLSGAAQASGQTTAKPYGLQAGKCFDLGQCHQDHAGEVGQ